MSSPSTAVIIPESYIAYREIEERRKSYDLISGMDGRRLPPNFTFKDINAFYEARFALSVVQCEYYRFLHEFWDLTWGAVLQNLQFREFTAGEYAENYPGGQFFSFETVWRGMFQRAFWFLPLTKEHRQLWLGGYLNGADRSLYLFLGIYEEGKDITAQKFGGILGSVWQPCPSFGGKSEGLCVCLDEESTGAGPKIIIDGLCNASAEALRKLKQPYDR